MLYLYSPIYEIISFNGDTFIFGDFNIPIPVSSDKLSNIAIYFIEKLESLGFSQIVKSPTRKSHILDFVLVIKENFGTSDHKSIEIHLSCSPTICNDTRRKFDYFHGNYVGLNSYFANTNWKIVFANAIDVDDLYQRFLEVVQLGISNFIRFKKSAHKNMPPHIRNLEKFISK